MRMTIDEAIKEISEAVESHKQFKLDLRGRHIAEVLVLKSAKFGADRLAEALEVALEELKKDKPENILADAEKEYLSAVIKPFRKRVVGIEKLKQVFFDNKFISQDQYCDKIRGTADYLLDNGVIVLPCKVGDRVWVVPTIENNLTDITEMECIGFAISHDNFNTNLIDYKNKLYQPCFEQFGEKIFLSREEAEAALKAREK